MAESIVTLRVDTRNAVSSLNNASAATNKLSVASKGATKSLAATSTAAKGLGTAVKNSIAPLLALGTAFSVVNNSIGTFLARERDIAILEQGINNLGASSVQLRELQRAADELGKTTLFNQEEFTRGFNLLTSFRNIGVDSYSRVAQAAADIAQVNQVDVSTSFMQLAKALQDPERNLSNLNRSGIAFTKQQTKVIKELMKTNQVAKAHTMILDIVDESYNKLAQAAAVGFAGSVDTLGESFRDFSEALGKSLIPVVEPAVKALTALLNALSGEGGQAVAIISGAALAFKGLSVVIAGTKAQLATMSIAAAAANGSLATTTTMAFATAGGFAKATAAVTAFKVALAKTGIGLAVVGLGILVTKLLEAKNAQSDFNDLVNEGTTAMINQAITTKKKEIDELKEKISGANKELDTFSMLIGLQNIGGVKGITQFKGEVKKLEAEIKKLEEGLPAAEARDLANEFERHRKTLTNSNAQLEKNLIINKEDTDLARIRKEHELAVQAIIEEHGVVRGQELILLQNANLKLKEQELQLKKNRENAERLKNVYKKIGDDIATGISDALHDAVLQTKSLGDAARSILQGIASDLLRLGINTLLKSTGIGLFSNLTGFANGGRPPVGRASIVGEKGPELFVPTSAGTIIPNDKLAGGGMTNNIVVNVSMEEGVDAQGGEEEGRQLGRLIAVAVQSEIIQQKRAGGLLA